MVTAWSFETILQPTHLAYNWFGKYFTNGIHYGQPFDLYITGIKCS